MFCQPHREKVNDLITLLRLKYSDKELYNLLINLLYEPRKTQENQIDEN
jgi:hypothetical protein